MRRQTSGDDVPTETDWRIVARDGRDEEGVATELASVPAVESLIGLQRRRQFLIRTKNRLGNAMAAHVRSYLGWRPDLPDKESARLKRLAQDVAAGKTAAGLPAGILADLELARLAAEPFRAQRATVEKEMKRLARGLPVWAWAKDVKGLGELGLAVIVAEAGALDRYATVSRLWKRLGYACIREADDKQPVRQQRRVDKELAKLHGYSPRRRAEIHACVTESLFKHQWQAAVKDDDGNETEPARPKGPYGEVYARHKARKLAEEWTPLHAHRHGMSMATKALLADLWSAWRRCDARRETEFRE